MTNTETPWTAHKSGVYSDNGVCVAMRHPQAGQEWSEVAPLIAAAPDLLATCKELALRIEQYLEGTLIQFPAALLPQARQAIENATGQPFVTKDPE